MTQLNFDNLNDYATSELIEVAQRWLHNEFLPNKDVQKLARELEGRRQFSFSRRLHEQLLGGDQSRWDPELVKRLAFATYKDDELPSDRRFEEAAALLIGCFGGLKKGEEVDVQQFDPARISDQEVLGQLGSIYKRKWKYDSQIADLYRSLEYYKRGFDIWKAGEKDDQFYTGINAAFVCDLLANTMRNTISRHGVGGQTAAELTRQADTIRQKIIEVLAPRLQSAEYSYWEGVTLAEAYMGLGKAAEAAATLEKALTPQPPEKHRKPQPRYIETTVFQLAELVQLRFKPALGAPEAEYQHYNNLLLGLEDFLYRYEGKDPGEARKSQKAEERGKPRFGEDLNRKIGLALSGGGFRASLFHIGVLAKLAELDLLRHVQVVSCVSGGSIIGAYYYLELQKLLEQKKDDDITPSDYVTLVKRIEKEFLQRINGNLRVQVLGNAFYNLKIAILPGYSRTNRLADLYEKDLYRPVFDFEARKKKQQQVREHAATDMDKRLLVPDDDPHIYMDDLRITPLGDDGQPDRAFNPKRDNWKRFNKIPALILNATTLNTGHNWQFTASYMGETPSTLNKELSAMYVFRRMYYWEAPKEYRKIRLADAVGASSCVPVLFAPVQLPKLYPGKTVQLVDGGVYDNQGIDALLEAECDTLIVSDACGQLTGVATPPSNEIAVFFRSDTILQERLRDSQFRALFSRSASGAIKGFLLMHLTKGLKSESIEWERCTDLYPSDKQAELRAQTQLYTPYGIRSSIQERLALVRTDLDAFHEKEAWALMHSGYKMTETEYSQKNRRETFPRPAEQIEPQSWAFKTMDEYQRDDDKTALLERLLDYSASLFFKPLMASALVRMISGLVVLAAALAGARALGASWYAIGIGAGALVAAGLLLWWLPDFQKLLKALAASVTKLSTYVVATTLMLPTMLLLFLIHLVYRLLLNKPYLRAGKIE